MIFKGLDKRLTCSVHDRAHQSRALDWFAIFIARDFPFLHVGIPLLVVALVDVVLALVMALVIFFSQVLVVLIQEFIVRERPYQREHLRPLFELRIKTKSFPSGHASLAWVTATLVFFLTTPVSPLWWFCLVGAVLITWSRLHAGFHYVSDVLAGGLLGFFIAWAFHLFVL